ncbi:MAG: hypothetical protein AAGB10_15960 [Pseudomonadota bacterium]
MSDTDRNHGGAAPPEEDALLAAIRSAVTEAEARAAAPEPEPQASQEPPSPAPLILGAGVRVAEEPETPPEPEVPIIDENELRGIIGELVRDELEQALGGGLEARIRNIVRSELAVLLDRSRQR